MQCGYDLYIIFSGNSGEAKSGHGSRSGSGGDKSSTNMQSNSKMVTNNRDRWNGNIFLVKLIIVE